MKHKMRPDLAKGQKRPCIFADALCFIDYAEFFFFALASYICDVTFFPSYVSFFPRIFEVWPFSRQDADRRLANLSRQGLGGLHLVARIKLSEDLPLYRALAAPRSKERVQSQEISYTRARELIKDVLEILPDGSRISVYSLSLEESLLQLKPVSLVDFSSGMVVGRARTSRMATLRTILIIAYQSQNLWDSDLCFIVKVIIFSF